MISTKERPFRPLISRIASVEVVSVGLLFLTVLFSRIIFITHYLYHWDSVNFAFSLVEFNLEKEQPQPPGYIVYVWLVRLVNSLVHNADLSMVMLSVLASSLAVIALYGVGKTIFDARTGWFAALFLAVSPLFWFYGEIALPHTIDALLVIGAAWLLYRVMQGDQRSLIPAVIVLAVAGGIRQQTLIFLGPLAIFSIRKVGWKNIALSLLAGALVCLGWFIPLISQSGGLTQYLHVVSAFGDRFQAFTSVTMGAGWQGIRHNLGKLIPYTIYGLFLASVPYLLLVTKRVRSKVVGEGWEKWLFLGLWAIPTLAFYTFIHMGQQGLVFVFLPALVLIGAYALSAWIEKNSQFVIPVSLIALVSVAFFVFMPEYPLGKNAQRFLTRDTLVNSDVYYQSRISLVQNRFDRESTAILAANWRHVEYYLPAYRLLRFSGTKTGTVDDMVRATITSDTIQGTPKQLGLRLDASHHAYLVIFDPLLDVYNRGNEAPQTVSLPGNDSIHYYVLNANDVIYVNETSLGIIRK